MVARVARWQLADTACEPRNIFARRRAAGDPHPVAYPDPRILVCVLGTKLDSLITAARGFLGTTRFTVDEEYSSGEPDDRMESSFDVCWDRVHPAAFSDDDERAVVEHRAVLYALSPALPRAQVLQGAIDAVAFIDHLLARGAVAAKIENAGVAHGMTRWRALAAAIREARDPLTRARTARLAVTRRPIGGDDYYETIGNHLVGLPEVYVPQASVGSDREAVVVMDRVGDELAQDGVEEVIARYGAELDPTSPYEGDFEFKINPYGIVKLPVTTLPPTIRPSRPGL
jgi:hypothetical protein